MSNPRVQNRLKVHRAENNLTQADLANLVGVTRKTINTVETGRFLPSITLALRCAKVLNVPVEELFHLDE